MPIFNQSRSTWEIPNLWISLARAATVPAMILFWAFIDSGFPESIWDSVSIARKRWSGITTFTRQPDKELMIRWGLAILVVLAFIILLVLPLRAVFRTEQTELPFAHRKRLDMAILMTSAQVFLVVISLLLVSHVAHLGFLFRIQYLSSIVSQAEENCPALLQDWPNVPYQMQDLPHWGKFGMHPSYPDILYGFRTQPPNAFFQEGLGKTTRLERNTESSAILIPLASRNMKGWFQMLLFTTLPLEELDEAWLNNNAFNTKTAIRLSEHVFLRQ